MVRPERLIRDIPSDRCTFLRRVSLPYCSPSPCGSVDSLHPCSLPCGPTRYARVSKSAVLPICRGPIRSLRFAILLRLSTGLAIHGSAFDGPKQCFGSFRLTLPFCRTPDPLNRWHLATVHCASLNTRFEARYAIQIRYGRFVILLMILLVTSGVE
jgi:hypothetical protein